MALERTFSIIKPDAVAKNVIGAIYNRFESAGLRIVASKMIHMSKEQAEGFYAEHKERPFFGELVEFMSSGKCVVLSLKRENAVAKWREVIGATNPEEADKGTIRALYGTNTGNNAVHGSDSAENGIIETNYFFKE